MSKIKGLKYALSWICVFNSVPLEKGDLGGFFAVVFANF